MRVSIVIVILVIVSRSYSQVKSVNKGKEIILKAMNIMAALNDSSSGKSFYLDYNTKTIYRDKLVKPTVANIKFFSGKDRLYALNSEASVYKDNKYTYVVMPSKKTIQVFNNVNYQTAVLKNKEMFRKEAFDMAKVILCRDKEIEKRKLKEIELEFNDKGQKKYKVKRAKYFVDVKNNTLYQVIFIYIDEKQQSSVEITYNAIDRDYKGMDLSKPLRSEFFIAGNSLQSKYKGYKVIDRSQQKINYPVNNVK
jgi:hypothetical protein